MDPVTITSAAAAVIGTTAKVTSLILDLKQGIEAVDKNLDDLYEEIEALQALVNTISDCLKTDVVVRAIRKVQEQGPSPSFNDLKRHLEHCNRTVEKLRMILAQISPPRKNNILRKGMKYVRLEDSREDINRQRQQMKSHKDCLNVSLHIIFICQTLQSDERDQKALNELHDKVDKLSQAIVMLGVGRRNLEATVQQEDNSTEDETKLLQELDSIRSSSMAVKKQATMEIQRRLSVVVHDRNAAASIASQKVREWTPQTNVQEVVEKGTPRHRNISGSRSPASANIKQKQLETPSRGSSQSPESSGGIVPGAFPLDDGSFDDSGYRTGRLSADDLETAITRTITEAESRKTRPDKPFSDDDFNTISRLLHQAGQPLWSELPRTYLVLWMIGHIEAMDDFVQKGCKDINFPYSKDRLPVFLEGKTHRENFLKKQSLVLSEKTAHLIQGGRHRHFSKSSDLGFTVLRTLGSGGHGVIDHVRSNLSCQDYARKRIHRPKLFSKDKKALEMFENEIHSMKELEHDHLVRFVGSYTDPKYVGIIMTPVAETDLRQYLLRSPFPQQDLANLIPFFGCLCAALAYLHAQNVRHRDIKPGNILILGNKVLITDFGIARNWTGVDKETTTGHPGPYTSAYAAPEVNLHQPRNAAADIWSLGCVYLDMLTILKRSTLEQKKDFFGRHGSGSTEVWNNIEALHAWIDVLEHENTDHQEPAHWIRNMTSDDPKLRPDAETLFQLIIDHNEGSQAYCCMECGGDNVSDASRYQGSDTEDEEIPTRGTSLSPTATRHSQSSTSSSMMVPTGDTNTEYSVDDHLLASPSKSPPRGSKLKIPRFDWQTQTETKNDITLPRVDTIEPLVKHPRVSLRPRPSCIREEAETQNTFVQRKEVAGAIDYTQDVIETTEQTVKGEPDLDKAVKNSPPSVGLGLSLAAVVSPNPGSGPQIPEHVTKIQDLFASGSVELEAELTSLCNRREDWRSILLDCIKPTDTSKKYYTMLHTAANFSNKRLSRDVVSLYTEAGVRVNALNFASNTALQYAAARDNALVVQELLDSGSDLNHRNVRKHTALHIACMTGSEESFKVIIEATTRDTLNWRDDAGLTALHMACRSGSFEVVETLLLKGADITIVDAGDKNCLFHCNPSMWREVYHIRRAIAELKGKTKKEDEEKTNDDPPRDHYKSTGYARGKRQPSPWYKLGTESGFVDAICPCAVCQMIRGVESLLDSTQSPILSCACSTHIKSLCEEILIDVDPIDKILEECVCRRCAVARAPCGQGSTVAIPPFKPLCACPMCEEDKDTKHYRPDIISLEKYKGHDYYDARIEWMAPPLCLCKDCKKYSHDEAVQFLTNCGFTRQNSYRSDPNKAFVEFIQHIADRALDAEPFPDLFVDAISFLLDCGANINAATKKGTTMLHQAAADGQLGLTKLLIDRGAALNLVTKTGHSAAAIAIGANHPEILRLLLRSGARTEFEGISLLCAATAKYGTRGHMVPMLLAHNPPINTATPGAAGEVALYFALEHRNTALVELLIKAGADLEISTRDTPKLINAAIVADAIDNSSAMTKLFLAHNASVKARAGAPSALQYAAMLGKGHIAPVMQCLLEYEDCKLDLNARDAAKRTPLHWMAESNYQDVSAAVTIMIASGADVSAEDTAGCTPLHVAARAGSVAVARALVEAGAIPEVQNYLGKTPLDLAAGKKHREVVALLGGTMPKKRWYRMG